MRLRSLRFVIVALGLAGVGLVTCAELDLSDALAKPAKGGKGKADKARPGKGKGKAKAERGGRRNERRTAPAASARPIERTRRHDRCPSEMVNVRGQFCIDRWEARTVDAQTGAELSPYYPPHAKLLRWTVNTWATNLARDRAVAFGWIDAGAADGAASVREAGGARLVSVGRDDGGVTWSELTADASAPDGSVLSLNVVMQLPELPEIQTGDRFKPMAVSKAGEVPQGHTPGFVALEACRAAGKRLCREEEWVTACKGERGTKHPYGPEYRHGACNVFRSEHPAHVLHGNASEGLSDPRLNQVTHEGAALLRETGGSPLCRSVWGSDAIYDMVGNVDEWVDDPGGMFLGGFYSRATRNGCESKITAHPTGYFDYSLGFRCCADLESGPRD